MNGIRNCRKAMHKPITPHEPCQRAKYHGISVVRFPDQMMSSCEKEK
jgi:hypothetical protein